MTKKSSFDFSVESPQKSPKYSPIGCAAHGCPCFIDGAGIAQRKNVCWFHDGIDPRDWGNVTFKVRRYEPLIRLANAMLYEPQKYNFLAHDGNARIEKVNRFLDRFGLDFLHIRDDLIGCNKQGQRVYRSESAYEFAYRLNRWITGEVRKGVALAGSQSGADGDDPELDPFSRLIYSLKTPKSAFTDKFA